MDRCGRGAVKREPPGELHAEPSRSGTGAEQAAPGEFRANLVEVPRSCRRVFEFCVGREFRVVEVDESRGVLVLDVSAELDPRFGGRMNDIRVEREFVESCG